MQFVIRSIIVFSLLVLGAYPAYSLEVSIDRMKPGDSKIVYWKDLPVYIVRRSSEQIQDLKKDAQQPPHSHTLRALTNLARSNGNEIASQFLSSINTELLPLRSYNDEFLVVMGITTYRGCFVKLFKNEFYDPCNDEYYDLSGRLLNYNDGNGYHLLIPPYEINKEKVVLQETTNVVDFSPDILNLSIPDGEKLIQAILWKKESIATILLARSPEITSHETLVGATPLHIAAFKSSVEMVNKLSMAGSDINNLTQDGLAPIHFAIMTRNEKHVEFLLTNGAIIENHCVKEICMPNLVEYVAKNRPNTSRTNIDKYINHLRTLRKQYTSRAHQTQ